MVDLTFISTSSFTYENFVIGDTSDKSISALNWFQNRSQSVCVPFNFAMTSFGNLALIDLSFFFNLSGYPLFAFRTSAFVPIFPFQIAFLLHIFIL